MMRRLRGFLLGIVLVGLNILLVAALVIVTSGRPFSGATTEDAARQAPGETVPPTPTPEQPPSGADDSVPQLPERFAAGDPISVVVLGDQTGTHENEWVQAWARTLAGFRPVELFSLSATDPTTYDDPISLEPAQRGGGTGPISIYNGSRIGASPAFVTPRLPLLVPEGADVVLLNFGRSNTPADITGELSQLSASLDRDWPRAEIRVIVQPPRQDGEPVLDELVRDWAAEAGLTDIDVAAAFVEEGIVEATVSTRDPLSVNILGGLTWARVVQDTLFGPLEQSE